MKPAEIERVRRHTSERTNAQIDRHIAETIRNYADKTEGAITVRLDELDREWDIERAVEAHAATVGLASLALATTVNRRWLALTGGVLALLLFHGARGWCPPLPFYRRLGVRTRAEIDRERFALKFLRGDFDHVRKPSGKMDLPALVHAVEM